MATTKSAVTPKPSKAVASRKIQRQGRITAKKESADDSSKKHSVRLLLRCSSFHLHARSRFETQAFVTPTRTGRRKLKRITETTMSDPAASSFHPGFSLRYTPQKINTDELKGVFRRFFIIIILVYISSLSSYIYIYIYIIFFIHLYYCSFVPVGFYFYRVVPLSMWDGPIHMHFSVQIHLYFHCKNASADTKDKIRFREVIMIPGYSFNALLFFSLPKLFVIFPRRPRKFPTKTVGSLVNQQPLLFDHASIRYAVVADLSRDSFTAEDLNSAIKNYAAQHTSKGMALLTTQSPIIINSQGSLLTAVTLLSNALTNNTGVNAVVIADTPLVTEGVVEYMSQIGSSSGDAAALISVLAAGDELCNVNRNPQVICLGVVDNAVAKALLETTHASLGWDGVSTVLSDTIDGRRLQQLLDTELALTKSPIIVKTELFPSSGSDADDFSFAESLLQDKEPGVACFLSSEEMMRLHSAYASLDKDNSTNELFFIGNYMALNALDSLTAADGPGGSICGSLFVPHYKTATELKALQIVDANHSLDELGAYTLSYLCDALEMMAQAESASVASLRAVNFTGLTGQVQFQMVGQLREGVAMHLITSAYPVSSPIVTYTATSTGGFLIQNVQPSFISNSIPASPLASFTVCLAFPPNCADVSSAMSVLYVMLLESAATSYNAFFRAINTGNNGVEAFAPLVDVARQCSFLIGSGHASIDSAMAPIVNNFQTTQIEYQAASSLLTSHTNPIIPTFSRTVPMYSFSEKGFAEVCSHFGWERVIIITTSSQFGRERGHEVVAAMVSRNIYVEQEYHLADTSRSTILATLKKIYDSDVSRIIFMAVPLFGDDAKAFFNLIDEATFLHNYVFLLDHSICAYGVAHPSSRNKLQSSICMFPQVDLVTLAEMNSLVTLNNLPQQAKYLLAENGFIEQAQSCDYSQIPVANGFAVDAALLALTAVTNAASAGVSIFSSSALLPYVRNNTFVGITGQYTIDSMGNRDTATYDFDIQIPSQATVIFGTWSESQKPNFKTLPTEPWLWMTNKTTIPLDTFRDASFVFQSTALSSPGVIAISVLGFVITIFSFFLCYRHYHIQRKIEEILVSNTIPITDTELKHLRGLREEC
eukprot:gene4084-2932_t